jgi:hypothetical protein
MPLMSPPRVLVPAALISVLCILLWTAVGVNAGQASSGTETSVNGIVVEDPGFSSPQAALQQLVGGVATGNVDSGAQGCATVSLAQHFNWTAFERSLGSWSLDDPYTPSQYGYWQQGNAALALSRCTYSMQNLAMRLVAPHGLGLLGGVYSGSAQKLAAELDPAGLSELRVVRFDQVRFAGVALKTLQVECGWEGGEQCASGLALLQMGSSYWLVGPSFVEYDGKWRIAGLVGDAGELAGVGGEYGTLAVSKAQYVSDLAHVRHTASKTS